MSRSHRFQVFLFTALLASMLVGCVTHTEESRHIVVSVNSWPGFAPLYLADERGYFQSRNIDVEIVRLEGGADRRAGLISGRLDVLGASLDDFAVTIDRGADAVVFGCADLSDGADGIVVGSSIHTLSDLANAEVAVEPGLPNHFFLLYVLDKEGLPIDHITINPMQPDDAGAAFIAKRIDAAVTWEPHLTRALQEREDARVLVRSSQYPEAIMDLFIANRNWLDENASLAQAFTDSWDEAVAYLRADRKGAYRIIGRRLGLESTELDEIYGGIRILNKSECKAVLDGRIPEISSRVVSIWSKAGYLTNHVDLAERFRLD